MEHHKLSRRVNSVLGLGAMTLENRYHYMKKKKIKSN